MSKKPQVLEFFAGIGLARLGLEAAGFEVTWANDYEVSKKAMYERNFGTAHDYALGDVAKVEAPSLPSGARLAWASSPCTDLSLAGGRAGFAGKQSGTFWQFIRIISELGAEAPAVIVLENVIGLATSHGGDDLAAAIRAFNALGYSADVVTIDAKHFLPQSRPRLFIVGSRTPVEHQEDEQSVLRPSWLQAVHQDPTLVTHRRALPDLPPVLTHGFSDLVKRLDPIDSGPWWDDDRVERFVSSLSAVQLSRILAMKALPETQYRTAYRRTRKGVPTWEVRADDIAGCLRTARGGSSKQAVVCVGEGQLKVRWMASREYAALMGAEDFDLDSTTESHAQFGFGDAVAVPVVQWLAEHYLYPVVHSGEETAESVWARG